MRPLVQSEVRARRWELACLAILVLPFLPSDVTLQLSQDLG